MRPALFRLLTVFVCFVSCFGRADELRNLVSQRFPRTEGVEIVCWAVPQESEGFLSQIVVVQTANDGSAKVVWQSSLEPAYSPRIRFVEEIMVSGVPIALVERQNGAATSQLDIIGKVSGRFQRILKIDGFQFDVAHLDGSKLPFIVAHTQGNILDIPVIYRWNGSQFVDDSASHPESYRELLIEDEEKIPSDSSGVVLVNLAKIAVLSGNRAEAKRILAEALSKERANGNAANKETLRRIAEALQDVGRSPR